MRTWAFVSQKGGSGKSTLSTQLAVYADECGEAVAIVDLDPQASAAAWGTIRGSQEPSVIPGAPNKLVALLDAARTAGATLMLIDTAPHTDAGALAAIRSADLVICPTQPSLFDVAALKDTAKLLDLCGARERAVCVINGVPHQGAKSAFDEAAAAVAALGLRVCPAYVGHRRPFVSAIGLGKGVTETAKKDPASTEIRALWAALRTASKTKAKEKVQ